MTTELESTLHSLVARYGLAAVIYGLCHECSWLRSQAKAAGADEVQQIFRRVGRRLGRIGVAFEGKAKGAKI